MPLFEYKCEECGASFEKLVLASKRDSVVCGECGSAQTKRQLSTFAAKSSGSAGVATAAPRFT